MAAHAATDFFRCRTLQIVFTLRRSLLRRGISWPRSRMWMRPCPSIPREAYFGKLPVCKKIVRLWWASRPLRGSLHCPTGH